MKNNKHKIRANFNIRVVFVILSLAMMVTLVFVFVHEKKRGSEWKQYQEKYNRQYEKILAEKIQEAEQEEDEDALRMLRQLEGDLARSQEIRIRDVFLPGPQVRDLCMTCHVGINNPLFEEADNPLKAHPPEIVEHHDITRYGCTLCHHGQGVGLSVDKAHGYEHNWEKPRIPMEHIESSCFECHETVYGLEGAENAAAGKRVFVEFGCYGCHDANIIEGLPKFSAPFSGMSKKIKNRQWVVKWLEDPQAIRPGTLMPDFRVSPEEINDIVAYVYPLEDKDLTLERFRKGAGDKETGEKLFTDKGCVGCHSPERENPGLDRRVPLLAEAGLKLADDWIFNWIGSPHDVNPDTWMPEVELTDREVEHLTAYMLTLKDEKVEDLLSFEITPGESDEGRILVQSLGCLGCHNIKGQDDPSKVGVGVWDVADKRMEELPFGDSDVEHTKWDWLKNKIREPAIYQTHDMPMYMPDHVMDDEELEGLVIFYLFNRLLDIPEKYIVRASETDRTNEYGEWLLQHYSCRGCHEIIKDEKPRIETFITRRTMLPPSIVDQLEKIQPDWLFNYLRQPDSLRPWINMRMPQFHLDYDEKMVMKQYLHSLMSEEKRKISSIPYEPALVRSDYDDETIEMGKYRFRNDQCMQCHPVSFDGELPEDTEIADLSIDLLLSKSRLRIQWVIDFMRNPAQYAGTATRMPYVFYTPDRVPRIPDPEAWLERTALYLMFMNEVPEPIKTEERTREVQTFDFSDY